MNALWLLLVGALAGEVYRITPKTFERVTNETAILIRFCPMYETECRETQSAWEGTVDTFEEYEDEVTFGEFDCTKYTDFCDSLNIKNHFPVYVAFTQGDMGRQIMPFDHNVNTLSMFIHSAFNLGSYRGMYTTMLSDKNFDKITQDPKKDVVVLFYDYWCLFSRGYAKTVEQIAFNYYNDKDLVIARMDCTFYKDICERYNATKRPQFVRFDTNMKSGFPFFLDNNIQTITDYINNRFQKDRDVRGLRPRSYGTWYVFDNVAKGFLAATDKEDRINVCREFKLGEVYIDIMKKIMEQNSDAFIEAEISELEFRLDHTLKQITPADRDKMQRRLNVLRKFVN